MKTCTKCHEEKALSEFYKRSDAKGGLQYWCKTCINKYAQRPQSKAVRKKYAQSTQGKAAYKKYAQSARGKAARKKHVTTALGKKTQHRAFEKYRKTPAGKNKISARKAVACALKTRRLTKGPCAICSTNNSVEAHHPDYTKPLAVEWYCTVHHKEVDALKHKEENHGTKN